MMKIRIIELLNKIANGEELPQKILIKDIVWYLVKDSDENFTYSQTQDNDWQKYIDYKMALTRNLNEEVLILDDEVEILEDNTEEIEELKPVKDGISYRYEWSEIPNKINELVKAINSIRKEKNND